MDNTTTITPDISEILTGTPAVKVGNSYLVGGIGGNFIPGSGVVSVNGMTGTVLLDADDVGALSEDGADVTTVVATSGTVTIPAKSGKIYLYNAVAGDVFEFASPASGDSPEFEIDIQQSSESAVTFSLPSELTWRFATPNFNTAGKLYQIKCRYVNGTWEGWTTPEMSEYWTKSSYIDPWSDPSWRTNGGYLCGPIKMNFNVLNQGYTGETGLFVPTSGYVSIWGASKNEIDNRSLNFYVDGGRKGANNCFPIVPAYIDYAVKKCLTDSKLTTYQGVDYRYSDADKAAACSTIGALPAEKKFTAVTASSGTVTVPAQEGCIYTYTLTGGEVIVLTAPASGFSGEVEVWITQPSTAVTVPTFPSGVKWFDANSLTYASTISGPDMSHGNATYMLKFRYDGTSWLGKYEVENNQ